MRNVFPAVLFFFAITFALFIFNGQQKTSNQSSKSPTQNKISPTPLPPTPFNCKNPLPQIIEGPYYKTGTPEKNNFQNDVATGEKITLAGYVSDENCQPIQDAILDFWQTDTNGEYDNTGYNLRGYQKTDSYGKYELKTIIPGAYENRTPHIHVKIRPSPVSPETTSQLYFPGSVNQNNDPIFSEATMVKIIESNGAKTAYYNFVVKTN